MFQLHNSLLFLRFPQADLLKLQTRLESEKAGVEEEVRNQLEKEFQEREREIADKLRKERDSQLEAAIQRLEEESSRIRGETENSAQEKIKWEIPDFSLSLCEWIFRCSLQWLYR